MSYLESLHARHEDWLISGKEGEYEGFQGASNTPVLILDSNADFEEHPNRKVEVQQEIAAFIESLEGGLGGDSGFAR